MFRRSLALLLVVFSFLPLSCAELQSSGVTNVLTQLVTSQLGVTADQANGGVGSILSLAKEKLPSMDFTTLTKFIPGADSFMKAANDLGAVTGPIGDQAGLTSAFSRLGMGPDMVPKFSQTMSDFVGKAGGDQAKNLLASVMK
ncbi:MAG: hypothetical protein CV081_09930 [Nitrospira sp. LK265]|nr:DUF2780 domain-containing protein [Nitrospira sp.]NGZ60804.1 hypothetical protein [Nitrospira sp. LK265]